jgi:hypothetical protein
MEIVALDAHRLTLHNLDIPRRDLAPFKAYPPLIVDAEAVLSAPFDLATG